MNAKSRKKGAGVIAGQGDEHFAAAYADARRFLRRPYVAGLSVGYARRGGQITDELAICIHVGNKLPDSQLTAAQRLPRTIRGVRVDVVEMLLEPQFVNGPEGKARRETRMDPVMPGLQIKTEFGSFGSVGLIARRQSSGASATVLLTAGHVLGVVGARVFQPNTTAGPLQVGRVIDVRLSGVDAGCTEFAGRSGLNRPFPTGPTIAGIGKAGINDGLTLSGAYSGVVQGVVHGPGQTKTVFTGGLVDGFFLNPLPDATGFTEQGDSGSLWFDAAGRAVGLHVAGSYANGEAWAFACDIADVMKVLGLQL